MINEKHKSVLPRPLNGRTKKESGFVSIGTAMRKSIEAHNEIAAENDHIQDLGCSPVAFSHQVGRAAAAAIASSEKFKKALGIYTLQEIKSKLTPSAFHEEKEKIIGIISDAVPELQMTRGCWGAHEALKNTLVNAKKHQKKQKSNSGKKAAEANGSGEASKSNAVAFDGGQYSGNGDVEPFRRATKKPGRGIDKYSTIDSSDHSKSSSGEVESHDEDSSGSEDSKAADTEGSSSDEEMTPTPKSRRNTRANNRKGARKEKNANTEEDGVNSGEADVSRTPNAGLNTRAKKRSLGAKGKKPEDSEAAPSRIAKKPKLAKKVMPKVISSEDDSSEEEVSQQPKPKRKSRKSARKGRKRALGNLENLGKDGNGKVDPETRGKKKQCRSKFQ